MAGLKSLLKDTAIYGISSIVGRFLNYLLVPIYAASMSAASGGYGVVTEVYAWTALLMMRITAPENISCSKIQFSVFKIGIYLFNPLYNNMASSFLVNEVFFDTHNLASRSFGVRPSVTLSYI